MTNRVNPLRQLAIGSVAVLTTALTFGATVTPAPAYAQSGAYYRATLQQPVEKRTEIIRGGTFICSGTACVGTKARSRPNWCARSWPANSARSQASRSRARTWTRRPSPAARPKKPEQTIHLPVGLPDDRQRKSPPAIMAWRAFSWRRQSTQRRERGARWPHAPLAKLYPMIAATGAISPGAPSSACWSC